MLRCWSTLLILVNSPPRVASTKFVGLLSMLLVPPETNIFGWFQRLKNSARNCSLIASLIGILRKNPRLQFCCHGARKVFLPIVPMNGPLTDGVGANDERSRQLKVPPAPGVGSKSPLVTGIGAAMVGRIACDALWLGWPVSKTVNG